MRKFSNFFLNAAVAVRKVDPLFRFLIAVAFKARKIEANLGKEGPVQTIVQEDDFRQRLSAAVRMGLHDVRRGLLKGGYTEREIPVLTSLSVEDEGDAAAGCGDGMSKSLLKYAIEWGNEFESEVAAKMWERKFPDDVVPGRFVIPTFERVSLNGAFKVTPQMKKVVRTGIRERRSNGAKGKMIVVANKTNTAVSLALGKLGDEGGVVIPKPTGDPEPFFLTDHASSGQWLASSDFRYAIAKGWITVLSQVR